MGDHHEERVHPDWLEPDMTNAEHQRRQQEREVARAKLVALAMAPMVPVRRTPVPPPLPSRASVVAYLQCLPAGGIAEIVAEARVAEWRHTEGMAGDDDATLWGDGLIGSVEHHDRCDGASGYLAVLAEEAEWRFFPWSDSALTRARAWVEAAAIADGWTIARGAP